MKLLIGWINQAKAASYVPRDENQLRSTDIPHWPHLLTLEKGLWILLFLVLIIPLIKVQKDLQLEKQRLQTLKSAAAVGILAIAVHLYRIL